MKMESDLPSLKLDFAIAIQGGDMKTLENILAAYPKALRWKDVIGGTALRKAVAHGAPKMEVVRFFINRGANIEAKDKDGLTPLMFAAMHAETEVLSLLLEKGAKTETTDKKARTAVQIAYDCGHPDSALAILAHEQRKRDLAEEKRVNFLNDEAAQAHKGLDHALAVKKPLVMRR